MMRETTLSTPWGGLNLAAGPNNGPALLLLHGFTNRWQTFSPILPALEADWQVFAFDHRGHGRSARIADGYNAASFYADAEAVLQHVLSTRQSRVALLGHSMGGSMALHLAQNYPERVLAVVTGDTSLNLAQHIDVMNNRRNTRLFGLRRKLAGHSPEELVRRGLSAEQAEEMSQLDPRVMDFHAEGRVQDFFSGIQDIDFDRITCPVLLSQANPAKGGLLQDDEVEPVLAKHPGLLFKRFDCGHDLEIERGPDSAFFQAALAFLNGVEPN